MVAITNSILRLLSCIYLHNAVLPPPIRGHNIYNFYVYAHTVSKPSFGSRGCTPSQRKRAPWLGIQQTISLRR